MNSQTIQLLSAISGLIGSVILAFSLARVVQEFKIAITAFSVSAEAFAANGEVFVIRGLDKRINAADRFATVWTGIGVAFLVASTILGAIAIYLAKTP